MRLRDAPFAIALAALHSGCVAFSPFETDLDDDERDQTARNVRRLMETPPRDGPLRFALVSDSHQDYDELCEVIEVIREREDVVFVVHLGDMTELGLREEYRWTLECLQQLDVPFFTAIGNHDTLSNGRDVYRAMFGAYDYSFRHADVRLVVLNTNELEFEGAAPNLAWLAEVTAPSPDTSAVIVAGHQRPESRAYEAILRDNGVSAVISAHFHQNDISSVASVPAIEVSTTKSRHWTLLAVDGATLSVANCQSRDCVALEQ